MTIEYVLMLSATVLIATATLSKIPRDTMARGGAKFASRVEAHLATGQGFYPNGEVGNAQSWKAAANPVTRW